MYHLSQFITQLTERWRAFWKAAGHRWRNVRQRYPRLFLAVRIGALSGVVGIFLFGLLVILVYAGVFGALPTYPELREIQNHTASEVYAEDNVLLGKYYIENRINADFEEISPNVVHALVATEDARFFEHRGIDPRAVMRVLFKTILLFDTSSGGGSTLSQQLAKNLYPRQGYWILTIPVNKIREMFTARRLEKLYTKEELLRLYLNTVPFGENTYGIKVAARRFFNKSPEALKLEEAAVLVGMLKATTSYNPVRHRESARTRRNTVLSQMQKYGYLTAATRDSLQELPLNLDYTLEGHNRGLATYFREHLRQELEEILKEHRKPDGKPYNLYTDGLRIYTSIDARLQQYAQQAMEEHMAEVQMDFYKDWKRGTPWGNWRVLQHVKENSARYRKLKEQGVPEAEIDSIFEKPAPMTVFDWKEGEVQKEMSPIDSIKYYLTLLNTGFLAMEPGSGLVRAWVGGIDHKYFQYDHVKAQRQVGSTFKPIVFAQALRSGKLPCEYTPNERRTYEAYNNWSPRNADGAYGGVYSMEGALSNSVNAVTVELLLESGIDSVRQLARTMGLKGELPEGPAIGLGAVDASLLEMVQVYGAFANRGRRPVLHYLDRIETSDGQVIAEFERPDPRRFPRVLSEREADMMIEMLQSVVDSGTARRLRYRYGLTGDIAGKTGTTQNHTDGWFLGFTPKLVAGVWVGADNPSVHFKTMYRGQGSSSALPLWGRFMRKVYQDPAYKKWRYAAFPEPDDTVRALLQCPFFLEEMPIVDEYRDVYQEDPEFFNRLFTRLIRKGADTAYIRIDLRPRRNRESREAYFQRMYEYNERLARRRQRREERKDFWDKLLFGKDEDEGG